MQFCRGSFLKGGIKSCQRRGELLDRFNIADIGGAALSFTISLTVYILTLYPGVGGRFEFGDATKFQFIGKILGVPHSTGYPLYVLITHLWGQVPFPESLAWKINLLSALFAAVTNGIYFLLLKKLTKNILISLLTTLLLAFSFTYWGLATQAEVYTLNSLFVVLVLYLAIQWHKTKKSQYFLAICFVYAVSFGNHLSMVAIFPALVYLYMTTDPCILARGKMLLFIFFCILLSASQYSYIYIRSHQGAPYLEYVSKNVSIRKLISFIAGGEFGNFFFPYKLEEVIFDKISEALRFLNRQFTVVGLVVGIFGFYKALKIGKISLFLLFALAGEIFFIINYSPFEPQVFYLPVFMIFAVYIAIFLNHVYASGRSWHKYIIILVILTCSGYLFQFNYQYLQGQHFEKYYIPKMVEVAKSNAIISYGENFYEDNMLVNYYKYGEELGPKRDINFHDIRDIRDNLLYLSDRPIFFFLEKSRRLFEKWGTDYEAIGSELGDFIRNLDRNDLVLISIKDEGVSALNDDVIKEFRTLGLKANLKEKFRWSYAAVGVKTNSRTQALERLNKENKATLIINRGDLIGTTGIQSPANIKIVSAGWNAGNFSHIFVNGKDVSKNQRGMNIVILDPISGQIKRNINVDTYRTLALRGYWTTGKPVQKVEVHSAGVISGNDSHIILNEKRDISPNRRGFNVAVIDDKSKRLKAVAAFDTYGDEGESQRFANFVKHVPQGDIVVIAVKGKAVLSDIVIKSLGSIGIGSSLKGKTGWSYIAIGRKGTGQGQAIERLERKAVSIRTDQLSSIP